MPFHVTARTDALGAAGLDEAIRRARAFADAGADAVFVETPHAVEQMAAVRAAVPPAVPLVANMAEAGKTPLRSVAELAAAGYRMIAFPLAGLLASTHAQRAMLAALRRDGTTAAVRDRMLDFGEMNRLLGLEDRYRRERRGG